MVQVSTQLWDWFLHHVSPAAKHALAGGSLQEVLQIHDVLARVYLARLCYLLSRAHVLDGNETSTNHTVLLLFVWSLNYAYLDYSLTPDFFFLWADYKFLFFGQRDQRWSHSLQPFCTNCFWIQVRGFALRPSLASLASLTRLKGFRFCTIFAFGSSSSTVDVRCKSWRNLSSLCSVWSSVNNLWSRRVSGCQRPPTLEISNCCSKSVLCADAFLNACDAGHHAMQSRSVWFTDASNLWSRTLLIWSFLCQLLTTEMVVRFHTSLVKKLLDFVQPGRSGKWMGIVDNSHPQVSRASISTNKRCKCSSRQRWQCTERGNPSSGS